MQTAPLSESSTETRAASFTYEIKRATLELHLRLESQALLSAIMMPSVSHLHYYCYLSVMKKIEEGYERDILERLPGSFVGHGQRKASELISDDLSNIRPIGLPIPAPEDYTIPGEKISVPFGLGFMYVMEGSKLGGKVIYKHIDRTLGYSKDRGAKYIADLGVDTFGLWKEFLSKFSIYVTKHHCEAEAIQGAKYAFSSIYDFFELNKLAYEI
jgi:heme oxygenase